MIGGCLKNVFAMIGCATVLVIGLILAFIFRYEIAAFLEENFDIGGRVEQVVGLVDRATDDQPFTLHVGSGEFDREPQSVWKV